METDFYRGIDTIYTDEFKSGGSRFIGFLFPVRDENDYNTNLKHYKSKFSDASHVCSACILGIGREYKKFSDDGEPSNSAGRPILNNLLSAELTYVGAVVIRYYGGKKLGIPGLIEAYGGTIALCIDKAVVKELQVECNTFCEIAPEKAYLLYNYLNKDGRLSYELTPVGQFKIKHPQSMTASLQDDLKKINTLAIIERND